MSAIFISHSSQDNAWADRVRRRLEAQGHRSVFLDFDPADGIPAGRDWEQELYHRLRACRAVLVLCSQHSMASRWCFAEITHAKSTGKVILPLRIDDCEIDPVLTSRQVIDLTRAGEDGWQRLAQGLLVAGLDPADAFDWQGDRPPYPGLLSFQEEDAAIFFGRDDEIQAGLDTLHRLHQFGGERWLVVLGASGSGKSSLVRAGLLPRLRRDRQRWLVLDTFRPGDDPFWALTRVLAGALGERGRAEEVYHRLQGSTFVPPSKLPDDDVETPLSSLDRALRRRGAVEAQRYLRLLREAMDRGAEADPLGGAPTGADDPPLTALARRLVERAEEPEARVLVVIDQFEELLTDPDDDTSNRFLELLRAATDVPGSPLLILATLRSDYFGQFQKSPGLVGLGPATLSVGPMTTAGIAQTVVEPARLAGIDLETGLVELLVDDARSASSLPLLAFALRELWERSEVEGRLTVGEYREGLGGLSGAVAKVADAVVASMGGGDPEPPDPTRERQLRTAFLALSRLDEDGRYARRPVPWDRFPAGLRPLLERFVQARLLVSRGEGDEQVLEVAHEALFVSWGRLRRWLDEDREFLLWSRRLREARQGWLDTERDDGGLLRGAALTEAEHWLAERPRDLDAEHGYIEASMELRDREEAAVRRRRRRVLRGVTAAALVCLVLAGVAAIESLHARRLATEGRAALMVEASSDLLDPATRALLLVESAALLPGREPEGGAREARKVAGVAIPRSVLHGHRAPIVDLDWSPDGRWLATASFDRTVRVYPGDGTGLSQVLEGHEDDVLSVSFDPAGTRLVTGSADGTVRLWSLSSNTDPMVLRPDAGTVHSARFDPVGERVVVATESGAVVLYDLNSTPSAPTLLEGHEGPVLGASFSPDGRHVLSVSEDGTSRLWDTFEREGAGAGQGRVVVRHDDKVTDGVWSADGRHFATASFDQTAAVCEVATLACERLVGHTSVIWDLGFDPAGERLATASADNTARIWALDGSRPPVVLAGHQDWVRDVNWRPDGRRLLTASHDGSAALWDADGTAPPIMLLGHKGWVREVSFSPDGRFAATASDDFSVRIWRGSPPEDPQILAGHGDQVWSAAFSHGGDLLVTSSADLTARIWDVDSREMVRLLEGHTRRVRSAEFSPDDRFVATWSDDGTARVWPLDPAGPPVILNHDGAVLDVNYNHDGEELATAAGSAVHLWRPDGTLVRTFEDHTDLVRDLDFSRDDAEIVSASVDRTVRARRRDGTGDARLVGRHDNQVMTSIYQLDGTRVLSASADRTARIWTAHGEVEEVGRFVGHESLVWSADLSSDGRRVVTASQDGTARVWLVDDPDAPPVFLEGHEGAIWDATFSRDGETIATTSADGTVRLWSLWSKDWSELVALLAGQTNACLTVEERRRHLYESPEEAREAYRACEARYGRLGP